MINKFYCKWCKKEIIFFHDSWIHLGGEMNCITNLTLKYAEPIDDDEYIEFDEFDVYRR